MGEEITLLLILKIKAEKRQALFDLLKNDENGIKLTKAYKGCISVEGRMSTSDDETIVLWQKWTSKEDQAAYMKMRQDSGFFLPWAEHMLAPPQTMYLSKDSF